MNADRRTRQGVRDLNPPGHNARPASCPCRRDPSTATRVEMRIRTVTVRDGTTGAIVMQEPRSVGVHLCVFCGVERFSEHDED